MKRLITICVLAMSLLVNAQAGVTVNVVASSGANYYGPSWSGYNSNALHALENGLSTYGDRATNPTGYEASPDTVDPWEIAVTNFKSWCGDINPTGLFANEHGNRMHFGLHVYGDGSTQFTLQDLSFEIHSSDTNDTLKHTGDFSSGYEYRSTCYGIDWGADKVKGGGDDTVYHSGNSSTLVDELVYVGVGNAWWPGGSNYGDPQTEMDDFYNWIAGKQSIDVTGTYTINISSGTFSGSDMVTVIPEPATMILLGIGGLNFWHKRKKVRG